MMSLKRSIDILASFFCGLLLAPLSSVVACAVRVTSPGPVLFWSQRIGKHNKPFLMPKFRSMRVDTPSVATHLLEYPQTWLTPIGPFLRKSSLDELPQLWSILIGDMSLVGPRPALFNQDDLITMRTELGIDALTPGLTGWAQINGRDDLSISEKVRLDAEYLQRCSVLFDFKILFLTILKVTAKDGVSH